MQLTSFFGMAALLSTTVFGQEDAPTHRLQRYHNHAVQAEVATPTTNDLGSSTEGIPFSTVDISSSTFEASTTSTITLPRTEDAASTFSGASSTALPGTGLPQAGHRKHGKKGKGRKLTSIYTSASTSPAYTNTSNASSMTSLPSISLGGCLPAVSTSTITITADFTSTISVTAPYIYTNTSSVTEFYNSTTFIHFISSSTSLALTTSDQLITIPFPSTDSSESTPHMALSSSSTTLSTDPTATVLSFVTPATVATGASSDLHPSITIQATTITTGTPAGPTANPNALHCRLHGLPIGDYFLAGFNENESSGPLTVYKCWQYCTSIFGVDMGCESYTFYPEEGTDAPRCDLYGGSVAQSLDSVNRYVPNVWYDLGCGAPPKV